MRGKNRAALLNRGDETRRDAPLPHMDHEGINGGPPLRQLYFPSDALVRDNSNVMFRKGYVDQNAATILGPGNATNHELFERRSMCSCPLYRAWN